MSETSVSPPGEGLQLSTEVTLAIEGLSKTFTGAQVLTDVSLELHRGEIVALIGQNGCGKSTLIKVLSGFHAPDPGAVFTMGGRDISHRLGAGAEGTGMAFIHQDLTLVPSMTILENLHIAKFETGILGRIRWSAERDRVTQILAKVGLEDVSPDRIVGDLSITEQALVAIARGLGDVEATEQAVDSRLLVLDEPTAYLPREGVERLFGAVRRLAAHGASVLFVSHRLDEVLEHCSRAIVLRGGQVVADHPTAGRSERDLVQLMLGAPPERLYPDAVEVESTPVLEVSGISGGSVLDVSFSAARGEIVGFVGLHGSGYDEIPYLLFGASKARGGMVVLQGRTLDPTALDPARAVRQGIAFLPADRQRTGGAGGLDVDENMTLPTVSKFTAARTLLLQRAERRLVRRELDRFQVTPRRPDVPLDVLSGGNQQKVLLAKWVLTGPDVLALHEPTQGVDVGAKRDIFAHLAELAGRGMLILISSVEHEDLAHLCSTVHIVSEGRIVRTISGGDLTAHEVASAVYAR